MQSNSLDFVEIDDIMIHVVRDDETVRNEDVVDGHIDGGRPVEVEPVVIDMCDIMTTDDDSEDNDLEDTSDESWIPTDNDYSGHESSDGEESSLDYTDEDAWMAKFYHK